MYSRNSLDLDDGNIFAKVAEIEELFVELVALSEVFL